MYFFINNTNNKPCLLAVHWTPIRLPLDMSIGNPLDFHWFGCGFAVSPLEKSVGLCGPTKNARTSTRKSLEKYCGKKAKKIWILLTLSPTESTQKSSGSVKTSYIAFYWLPNSVVVFYIPFLWFGLYRVQASLRLYVLGLAG